MEDLRSKLSRLRDGFVKKEADSRKINGFVSSAINETISAEKSAACLAGFNYSKGCITLVSKNKTGATELFYKKNQLEERLSKNKQIKRVVIK